MVFEQLKDSPSELIVALGRQGKQTVAIDAEQYPHTAAMDAKLKTPQGQAAYRKRKWIVEAPNGWIKSVLGFRQFSLRGLEKVKAEFKLVCLALNLRRMCKLRGTWGDWRTTGGRANPAPSAPMEASWPRRPQQSSNQLRWQYLMHQIHRKTLCRTAS